MAPRKKSASASSSSSQSKEAAKATLWSSLITQVEATLAEMVEAARATHEAATHPEAKPENDKDTRSVELSYLAAGQSARAMELQRALGELKAIPVRDFGADDAVAVGALVRVRDDDSDVESLYLMAPVGGGPKLAWQSEPVAVVSPGAPLGKALLGRHVDDELEVVLAGKKRALTVLALA